MRTDRHDIPHPLMSYISCKRTHTTLHLIENLFSKQDRIILIGKKRAHDLNTEEYEDERPQNHRGSTQVTELQCVTDYSTERGFSKCGTRAW
jgi:hypothetical protein